MDPLTPDATLPEFAATPCDLAGLRVLAMRALVARLEDRLAVQPVVGRTPLEDLSLRHLAKAAGTTGSALLLLADARHTDACILTRAVFEQLFTYLWVVQDPARVEARSAMVTVKQEWANAKYLEGLAAVADPVAAERLLAEAAAYKAIAETLLAEWASTLGVTEKQVRDEATRRVSAKAIEVNLGPEFSLPYAHYSGFVHSDGNALTAYTVETLLGPRYDVRGGAPKGVPLASDLHRALLRLTAEVRGRCPGFDGDEGFYASQADWLARADAVDRPEV